MTSQTDPPCPPPPAGPEPSLAGPPAGGSAVPVKVAVRDLVEFVLQSGDLRSTFLGPGRALAGTKGHQRIQKGRPATYEAEVRVAWLHQTPDLTLEIGGRIDGVWREPDGVTLDEIKTTTRPLATITRESEPVHWGQAKVYAFIWAAQNGLERIGVQLTYLHLDTLEVLEWRETFAREDLERFFHDLVTDYLAWARTIRDWQRVRDASIAGLAFPFARYREGQRSLAVAVWRALADGRRLFAQAPTGTGKTVATLFPALKALGAGTVAKIFYLTAKTVGRGVAEATLAGLAEGGLRCKVLTLTAKEKICFLPKPDCRPEACEHARGHFDRVRPALQEIFRRDRLDRAAVEEVARAFRVCPFEFSLFVSLWADVIIGDYNYAFDPRVYLRRFFEPPAAPYAFLVDEAHNLPDRAREMFSAELRREAFAEARRQVKEAHPAVARAIGKVTPFFRRAAKAMDEPDGAMTGRALSGPRQGAAREDPARPGGPGEPSSDPLRPGGERVVFRGSGRATPSLFPEGDEGGEGGGPADEDAVDGRGRQEAVGRGSPAEPAVVPPRIVRSRDGEAALVGAAVPEEFVGACRRFLKAVEPCLAADPASPHRETLLDLYFQVTAFVRVAETFDGNFVCYWEPAGRDLRVRLFCLDPSALLREALQRARGTVFFSATLLPMRYFFRLLGGGPQDRVLRLTSPFDPARLAVLVLPGIRTEFRCRDRSLEAVADVIHRTVAARPGNYLVYFPSYRYLAAVREVFAARHPEWPVLEQTTGMAEEARDRFLAAFAGDNPAPLVGFAVMGGIFGEGIDLRGERLIGAIVVGVGLPQICLERELIREAFETKAGCGFEFAYRYPGLNRVMQAAGRVIRTEEDRGVVLLLDERFRSPAYRSLFPPEWAQARTVASPAALDPELAAFWSLRSSASRPG
ncbi:MAG: ATP-dependent DNA helicase [Candidatus Riflebacteria bacterium]|nr:ATP-dependent DNA helicase [Candidatus Riflebacteria bacterium]